MGYYDELYGSILQDIKRGKSPLAGMPEELEGFPRFEHAAIGVRHKKGGLFSKGGSEASDELTLTLLLAVGWEIVSVESHAEFAQFYLQRRHEPDCQCTGCAEWKEFRARLSPE